MLATLNALAEGDHTAWALAAGASKVAAVQDNDGNSSYIATNGNDGEFQSFTVTNKPPAMDSINSVKGGAVIRTGDGSGGDGPDITGSIGARLNGTTLTTTGFGPGILNAYQATGYAPLNRPGGGVWLPADIASSGLQVVILCNNAGFWAPQGMGCTQLDLLLDYNPPNNAFVFLLCSLGPLVAVGLHEMARLAQAVYARTGSLIQQHEYEIAWRELVAYRWPTYFS
jgi:hypothetical protein